MAFNINTFITNMKNDGFRPNLFEVTITLPTGTPSNQFTFKAKATTIPGSSIGTAPLFYFGRQAKFAGNRQFDNWQVNVIMDEDDFTSSGTRGMFERWSSLINSHVNNVRDTNFTQPNGYHGEGRIVPFGKDGRQLNTVYTMSGCYPIDIGAMPLDWGNNDAIAEFPVTFAMQWWTSSASVV